MKRLLLPLALLLSVPLNMSCIKEITFNVNVTGEHCSWDKPVTKATMGHNYIIKIVPDEGYELFLGQDTPGFGIYIETKNAGPISQYISSDYYDEKSSVLTIPGDYVSSEITINATAQEIEQ